MTEDARKRRRYRKKRWAAAVAALWLAGYVFRLLPAARVSARFPTTEEVIALVYLPILAFAPRPSPDSCPYFERVLWLGHLGRQHAATTGWRTAGGDRQRSRERRDRRRRLSKSRRHHAAMLAPFFVHFNFCRRHSAVKAPPAVAAGIASEAWSIDRLLSEAAKVAA